MFPRWSIGFGAAGRRAAWVRAATRLYRGPLLEAGLCEHGEFCASKENAPARLMLKVLLRSSTQRAQRLATFGTNTEVESPEKVAQILRGTTH
jgi:hypothetical protein